MRRPGILSLVFFLTLSVGLSFAACCGCQKMMAHQDNAFHAAKHCCPSGMKCGKNEILNASCGDLKATSFQTASLKSEPLLNLIADKIFSLFTRVESKSFYGGPPPGFSGHFSNAPLYLQTSALLI